jgi:sec-independent protein translocase protein TatB
MPEISFYELILIAIVGLLVIGPERLPETLRTLGLWFGRMRRSFNAVKTEIEKEIGMDEVKRQLHNEAIMEEMKRIESEVKNTADVAKKSLNEGIQAADSTAATSKDSATAPDNPEPSATQSELPGMDPGVEDEISDLIAAQDGGVPPNAADQESAPSDDRDHRDAGAEDTDDRDHTDAGADDRDHTDAGAESDDSSSPQRITNG